MNELALCSGIGGLSLGLQRAGVRTVCYVERNLYRSQVLVSRFNDGSLDAAPIWDDVTTFDGEPWRGCVDIISFRLPVSTVLDRWTNVEEVTTSAISGLVSQGSFARLDRSTSSWKMYQEYSNPSLIEDDPRHWALFL